MKTHRSLRIMLALTVSALAAALARADTYSWTNLQSDIPGVALHTDLNLVNSWGMAANSTGSVIWVSDNGTGVSTLYHQDGTALPLVVTIPTSKQNRGTGTPTGIVLNTTSFFNVALNGNSQPARFIFVSEDGSISGWNPNLDPTHAIIAVDNGTNKGVNTAVYKGATMGVAGGHNFLFATNFHTGQVETYNETFQRVNFNGFVDPNLSAGYAPFGIRNINGQIYVTYALQNKKKHDDVAGPGNGFVNVLDTGGNFVKRLISTGTSTLHGDLLWSKATNYGSALSATVKSTFTTQRLVPSSDLSAAPTAHRSNSMDSGTCSFLVMEFTSLPESRMKHTVCLA